jgi:hypothetical protein
VTHHYGSWAYIQGRWCWAPPVTSFSVHFAHPYWSIGFAWYPGRVGWFHFGFHIGWFPLGPREPYYCYRRWGPRSVVYRKWHRAKVHHYRGHRHSRHAVVIKRGHLYATDNYRTIRVRDKDHSDIVKRSKLGMGFDKKGAHLRQSKEKYAFKGVSKGRRFHGHVVKGMNRDPSKARIKRGAKGSNKKNEQIGGLPRTRKRGPAGSIKNKRTMSKPPEDRSQRSRGNVEGGDSQSSRRKPPSWARAGRDENRRKGTQLSSQNVKRTHSVNTGAKRTERRKGRSLPQGSATTEATRYSMPRQPDPKFDRTRAGQSRKQNSRNAVSPPKRAHAQPTEKGWSATKENKSWRSPRNAEKNWLGKRPYRSASPAFSRNRHSHRSGRHPLK